MQSMIEIDDKIISTEILTEEFCCPLDECRGECCVEGNAGAPLEIEEVDILEEEYENYKPFMTPEGIEVVEREGFMYVDSDGDYCTPLVNDAECAYSVVENGMTLCAIEKAYRAGKTTFKKPISCHLYPIRLNQVGDMIGVEYHRWDICHCARVLGKKLHLPIYQFLKEPLIRRFGQEWYDELCLVAEEWKKQAVKGER